MSLISSDMSAERYKSPVIAAAMIVKNEESNIDRCLNSVKSFVDHIVIVDTGSTDTTIDIARGYNAHVYHHPWQDDFSLHRNQSIIYAEKLNPDWIFIIDADEEFKSGWEAESERMLASVLENILALTVRVQDINQAGELTHVFASIRLIRAGWGIRYKNPVHNQLVIDGDVGTTDLVVNHYGYDLPEEKKKAKADRIRTMLLKSVEENPHDANVWFYLSSFYASELEYEKAIESGVKALQMVSCLISPGDMHKLGPFGSLFHLIAMCHMAIGRIDACLTWLHHGLKIFPDDPDLNFGLTHVGHALVASGKNSIMQGAEGYNKSIEKYRERPELLGSRYALTADKRYDEVVENRQAMAESIELCG